jgi:lupus La protein
MIIPVNLLKCSVSLKVEFYFSDSNLPTDKHMTNLAGVSGTNPVKITEVHRFGRMQRFQPYSAVVAALKESHLLVVSGSEGLETVQRRYAFDPSQKDEARETRTIYAKGFGGELPTTQFDIEAFFAPYGPTNAVRLRRTDDKEFKGSCFIEFQDEEVAQKFLDLAPKPLWQGKVSLEIMSKREYMNKKNEQLRSGEISPNKTKIYNNNRGRGGFRRGYRSGREWQDRDHRDPDDWKKRREDDQKFGFQDYNRDRKHRGHGGMGGRGRGRGDRGPQNNEREHYHGRNGDR